MNPQISSTSICWQFAHLLIHDLLARLADANAETHDGVAVNARDALNAADAGAFASMETAATFFSVGRLFAIILTLSGSLLRFGWTRWESDPQSRGCKVAGLAN